MIDQAWLQWALTGCFLGTGLWTGRELLAARSAQSRVGHGFHLLMSVGMAAMVWPWGMMALGAQGALFSVATAWFLMLTVAQLRRVAARRGGSHTRPGPPGAEDAGAHPLWHQPYHALMMAAMAWMVLAMLPGDGGSHEHHHGLPTWSALLGIAFLVAMLVGTAIFAVDALTERPHPPRNEPRARRGRGRSGEHVNNAAMSLGMAAMIVPMVAA